MKKDHHDILQYIYKHDDAGIREISGIMHRRHNDHRDFYALAALLECNYIGFTGPVKYDDSGNLDTYNQVRFFQAYSQGEGEQKYENVLICPNQADAYLYVGAKGIEYFHQRSEIRKGWYLVATLAFISSVISGVIVSQFTSNSPISCDKNIISRLTHVPANSTGTDLQTTIAR